MKDPIRPFERQDGRRVVTAHGLQFMPTERGVDNETVQNEILTPGLIIGAVIRCHWLRVWSTNFPRAEAAPFSQRVHFTGTYRGDERSMNYRIPGAFFEGPAPVFEMSAWHHSGTQIPIGPVAVARLAEGERAIIDGAETKPFDNSFSEMTLLGRRFDRIGFVQIGGLYYVPPLEQA